MAEEITTAAKKSAEQAASVPAVVSEDDTDAGSDESANEDTDAGDEGAGDGEGTTTDPYVVAGVITLDQEMSAEITTESKSYNKELYSK